MNFFRSKETIQVLKDHKQCPKQASLCVKMMKTVSLRDTKYYLIVGPLSRFMEFDILLISRDFLTFILVRCSSLAITCASSHWILWLFSIPYVAIPFLITLLATVHLCSCNLVWRLHPVLPIYAAPHSQETLYITPFTSSLLGFPFTLTAFSCMVVWVMKTVTALMSNGLLSHSVFSLNPLI